MLVFRQRAGLWTEFRRLFLCFLFKDIVNLIQQQKATV